MEDYESSTKAYKEVLKQEPLFRHSIEYIGLNYLTQKDPDAARPYIFKYKSLVPDPEKGMLPLLFYYAEKGLWKEVEQIEELFQRQLKELGPRLHVNLLNAANIRKDFKTVEKHFHKLWELGTAVTSLLCDDLFKELREQPFFKTAMRNVKMPTAKHDVFLDQRNSPWVKIGKGNDELSIKPNNFFYAKADGNYLEIHYFDFHSLNSHLVRTTFKELLAAFNSNDIMQCHRGYVVNLKFDFEVKGNTKQRELYYPEYDISIPLSRSFKV
jgi:hypothetical protein